MSFRQKFIKAVHSLESRADDVARKIKRRIYRNTEVTIMSYMGYGTKYELWLKGRVLENHTVLPSFDDDSEWANFLNILRRFNSDELPNVQVKARYREQEKIVTTNHEGFFDIYFKFDKALEGIWHEIHLEYQHRRKASTCSFV